MSQLKDFIEIDKKFQNSINLQLDIDNRKKLNNYIPTRSSINILNGFLENVINNKEKANILIGPYGKGKSHLLLVLLAILKESEDKTTEKLLNKIEKISDVTANNARLIHIFASYYFRNGQGFKSWVCTWINGGFKEK